MAKKVIIDFSAQPVTSGAGFGYSISVDGFDIYYNSGTTDVTIEYIPIGGTPSGINSIEIGANLEETIQKTLDLLRTVYVSDLVFYSIVDNTIEAFVNADATVTVNPLINPNIDITTQDVEPSGINLIYYIIHGNYRLNIYKENYNGGSTEINGNITINKSSVDSILEPIRGTGLNISLEANQAVTFDEFLLADEFTYKTELLKNNVVIYEGYIKPDGVQQSFVNDVWYVNIESTDGLGALKDLSFVQSNGLRFTGKMSMYDVIKACLDRTRLSLTINTSINLEYTGYSGTNILKDVYVNSERFVKDGNDTVLMNCNEVLTSILDLFSGVVTQQDGQWWMYRPNDLESNGYTTFINQDDNTRFSKNLNKTLGSQINNFYPHHCDNNQQIEVKGAVSAYRVNYQYGFVNGLVQNPNLNHDTDLNYDNWTVEPSLPSNILINDPNDLSGVLMIPDDTTFPLSLREVIESDGVSASADTQLSIVLKVRTEWTKQRFYFKVKTDDGYFLNTRNEWELGEDSNTYLKIDCGKYNNPQSYFATLEVLTAPVPNDCNVSIIICRPEYFSSLFNVGIGEVLSANISDTTLQRMGIVGEFHTVSRILPPSSITKENQKVFNGDGEQDLIGSIFKSDQTTFTSTWNRRGKTESLPILGISAMDDLRIQSSPIKVFSGSVYGEIPYMSVVTIDNVTGLFMPIEWDYDIKENKSNIKFMQFYNFDLADISYEVSPDYGNSNVKPTIVG